MEKDDSEHGDLRSRGAAQSDGELFSRAFSNNCLDFGFAMDEPVTALCLTVVSFCSNYSLPLLPLHAGCAG